MLDKGEQTHGSNEQIPELQYVQAVEEARIFAGSRGVDFGSPGDVVRITTGGSAVVWRFSFDKISVLAKGRAWENRVQFWVAARAFSDSKIGPVLFWPLANPANDTDTSATQFITVEEFIHGTALDQLKDHSSSFLADPVAMAQLGRMLGDLHAIPVDQAAAATPPVPKGPLTCADLRHCANEIVSRCPPSLRSRVEKCLGNPLEGPSVDRIASFAQLELPALIQRLVDRQPADSRSLLAGSVFAHNDLHSGNIVRAHRPLLDASPLLTRSGGPPPPSYRFIDSEVAAGSRVPWSDFSLLDIHTRVCNPIAVGRKLVAFAPQGAISFARSYLRARGHHDEDDAASKDFVFIAQALGLSHLIRQALDFALRTEEGSNAPTCAMVGRLLSQEGLGIAIEILDRASTEQQARQLLLEQGLWATWLSELHVTSTDLGL
jgi:hypothetical protein